MGTAVRAQETAVFAGETPGVGIGTERNGTMKDTSACQSFCVVGDAGTNGPAGTEESDERAQQDFVQHEAPGTQHLRTLRGVVVSAADGETPCIARTNPRKSVNAILVSFDGTNRILIRL